MTLTWQPERSTNWTEAYSTQRFEIQFPGRLPPRKQIPSFVVPVLVDSPILAIWTDSDGKRPNWNLGGFVRWGIQSASIGPELRSLNSQSQSLQLGESTLLDLRETGVQSFQLRIFPQRYLPDLRLKVFEYIGPIGDSTEDLINIARADLTRIEAKIDGL
jgi:hypothetical protein